MWRREGAAETAAADLKKWRRVIFCSDMGNSSGLYYEHIAAGSLSNARAPFFIFKGLLEKRSIRKLGL